MNVAVRSTCWLAFFAEALADPLAVEARPDPEAYELSPGEPASQVVARSADRIQQAIAAGVSDQVVTMSEARMAGDGVLAMALGEYIVHAWDLAVATEQHYEAPANALEPAHQFLQGMIAPEYRGAESGFFDAEIDVASDASALDRLLGFAGRDPNWTP